MFKTEKIKVCYAVETNPGSTFVLVLPITFTIQDFLNRANQKQKSDFKYVWFENSLPNSDDEINDYNDKDVIFILTNEEIPPISDFLESISRSKKGLAVKPIDRPKVTSTSSRLPSKIPPPVVLPGQMKKPHHDETLPSSAPSKGALPSEIFSPKGSPNLSQKNVLTPIISPSPSSPINAFHFVPSDLKIITEEVDRPKAEGGKYRFFCSANPDLLLNGFDIDLDLKMNPKQCENYLLNCLKEKIAMKGYRLLVYLPGGLPFLGGQLNDFYGKEEIPIIPVIYGILTREITDELLNSNIAELCNVSDHNRKLMLSPLVDSTDKGLSDMACLLGYLNHDGVKGNLLMDCLCCVTHFPPLVTSLNRIIDRMGVTGRDIVTVSSSLFTYFSYMLPPTVSQNHIYEFSLRCCNIITHIKEKDQSSPPIKRFELQPKSKKSSTDSSSTTSSTESVSDASDSLFEFLIKMKMPNYIYFIQSDSKENYCFVNLKKPDPMAIEQSNNVISTFRPIPPLSIRSAVGCQIVQGRDQTFLYLMQTASKEAKFRNYIDIINPLLGIIESQDIEQFAKEQGSNDSSSTTYLIDYEQVEQIIMVAIDESGSMNHDLNGNAIEDYRIPPRVLISKQYLTTFANRTYGYRIPCIQGLISFNTVITKRCPLSPLVPDFEDLGLRTIQPRHATHLWDALNESADEIIKFNTDEEGNKICKNAQCRILVISDGDDKTSANKPEEVAKKLLQNDVIVDSVIVNTNNDKDECKMLCALCHITGGLSLRPQTVSEGLTIFEQSAFLNYKERKLFNTPILDGKLSTIPNKLQYNLEMITAEFFEQARKEDKFDTEIVNNEISIGQNKVQLATPKKVVYANQNNVINSPRHRRILRELHATAEVMDSANMKRYDPDMKIFTHQSNLDRWRVFIKGSVCTPYENKWWYLMVTFPDLYPVMPPVIRFITIPYHLNVSSEGRICLNSVEKAYISSKHVVDILQEIKELFLMPDETTPIRNELFDIFHNNREEYNRLATESSERIAKDDYQEYIKSYKIHDAPDDFKVQLGNYIPPYMLSQISGKVLDPNSPNTVKASSGIYYDRNELKQLVSSSKTPICVVTGKPLTERPEDFE
ncbi:hypothetical protein TRFO_19161 [Tritrichomonas foetus]|uniref:UBC core domain-containing protein n=1 Tax=Tritrichomonas foetus TaxID=1144522 RepID=A0A1J4KJY6_9EUKA|nr:hypothetical protein TRFO_19161 [Tritrichomonas foetus]|eukprot:OHT11426.1 hypothetical protein TRFO_19161 [Tritrichomonas foetus]